MSISVLRKMCARSWYGFRSTQLLHKQPQRRELWPTCIHHKVAARRWNKGSRAKPAEVCRPDVRPRVKGSPQRMAQTGRPAYPNLTTQNAKARMDRATAVARSIGP